MDTPCSVSVINGRAVQASCNHESFIYFILDLCHRSMSLEMPATDSNEWYWKNLGVLFGTIHVGRMSYHIPGV